MKFPMPPSLDGIPIPDKLRQVLQRWMSDLRLWAAGLTTGGGTIATQDEGVSVDLAATTLNFVGAGVTATDAGGHVTTVTVPGGGTGTVTSITATTPIVATPSPITGVGVVSHATSGVAAATYGDTTHYPIVTVDANGHVTAASNQAVAGGSSPLTTKGDIFSHDTVDNRFPVGTDGQLITADSTQSIGLKYVNIPAGSLNLAVSGFRKRWRSVEAINGSGGQPLPTSSFWAHAFSATTSQPVTFGSAWLSLNKSLDVSGGTTGSQVAWTSAASEWGLSTTNGGIGSGFFMLYRGGFHTRVALSRVFIGMVASGALIGNAEPSTSVNCVGFGSDSGDSQFTAFHNDASGTCVKDVINGGVGFPSTTSSADFYEIVIYAAPNQTSTISWGITNLISGVTASGSWTSGAGDFPAANTRLSAYAWWSNGVTLSPITVGYSKFYVEADY